MNPPILGYFADLLYKEDPNSEPIIDRRWITAAERRGLICGGRIMAATYVPLIAAPPSLRAVAWLVHCTPGPFITASHEEAHAYFMAGLNVDRLRFGGHYPREVQT